AKRHGARVLTGGKRSDRFDRGYFFEPTVLVGLSGDAKIMVEEPFAPVMPLLDFSRLDDVIRAANNTRYGLAADVFTNDLTVARRIDEYRRSAFAGRLPPQVVYQGAGQLCPWPGCGYRVAGIRFNLERMGGPATYENWLAGWWQGPGLVARCPGCKRYVLFGL